MIIRIRAFSDYLAAKHDLLHAAIMFSRCRKERIRSLGWKREILAAHDRMVRARFAMRTGQVI